MKKIISGIQQIGIGIPSVYEAFDWYRKHLNIDIPMFDDPGTAALMLPYTGGEPQNRHAILAISIQGGGGFEIWQYTSRTPQPAMFDIALGDLGIFVAKVKSANVPAAFLNFKATNPELLLSKLEKDLSGNHHFFVKDPYGNIFQFVHSTDVFKSSDALNGGTFGVINGCSDMDKSIQFYKDILGYNQVMYDETGVFSDFAALPGGDQQIRRVLLRHSEPRKGPFSRLLGSSEVELVQLTEKKGRKIFENRLWGDLGFIHLCFDVRGMAALKKECADLGYPFTVDSVPDAEQKGGTFDMGEASGHFTYTEDPDGTLIEFVETHKIPIMKKLGWYLNLRKRNPEKALPDWMLATLRFNRKND